MNFREDFRKALRSTPNAEASIEDVYIDYTCSTSDMEVVVGEYTIYISIAFMSRPYEDDVAIFNDDGDELDWMLAMRRIAAEEVRSYIDDMEDDVERCRQAAIDEEQLHRDLNYWCR